MPLRHRSVEIIPIDPIHSVAPVPLADSTDAESVGLAFGTDLSDWFVANGRDLPWRHGYAPYHVWVSEIMAQQTQLARVAEYFTRFVARWPSVPELAAAHEDEALRLWEGLGYYSRCRNLLHAARVMTDRYGGRVPGTLEELRALPGIGPYSAGAIASIAFNCPCPAVDANVRRVLARVHNLERPVSEASNQGFIEDRARALIPEGRARDFNQGLMELGALICLPRTPRCEACPVAVHCRARALGVERLRPVPGPAAAKPVHVAVATGVLAKAGRLYIQKRRADDVWPGLWEFPGGGIEAGESPEQAVVREFAEETGLAVRPVGKIGVIRARYTRFRVTLHGFFVHCTASGEPVLNEAQAGRFVLPGELGHYAFPAGQRRLADALLSDIRLPGFLQGILT